MKRIAFNLRVRVATEARGERAAVNDAPMVAKAESGASLGGEWEGEVVAVAHPGVENEGLSVEAEDGVGAKEGVGERNWRRVEQSIEQDPGMEQAAAGIV
jgi:hypothetical protein